MTNAEKFKEIFGIEIDRTPDDPCGIFDGSICMNHVCEDCPACCFWDKEYMAESEVEDETI